MYKKIKLKLKISPFLNGIPRLLSKLLEEKKAIKEAISEKKPMDILYKEKGIHFASLYEVKSADDGLTYFFTTKHGLNYIVALTVNYPLGVMLNYLNIYPEEDNIFNA